MAMFALLLAGETGLDLDVLHVLELVLIHDIVEIDAGDTWIHFETDREAARAREKAAADRLFTLLPPDLSGLLHSWWEEFEEAVSPEARFARAMDRLQGFSQNIVARGRVWRERNVSEEMTRLVNKEAMESHPLIAQVYEALYQRAREEGLFLPLDPPPGHQLQ